ncbi:hypothetical protein [Paenibacillus segetis]|uniref:Uncharacterized protein n=1 Tax=Paenibacillus segetis TaxID=1325360 RepID=A0ABQ1YBR0_9BACL|nr:hypothetical protein [Paenibacillus segetis]GGH19570.1 hypothetical protein GCM10008013_16350 [Paenibacillus segetis]
MALGILANQLEQLKPDTFEPIFIEAYQDEPYFLGAYEQFLVIKHHNMHNKK